MFLFTYNTCTIHQARLKEVLNFFCLFPFRDLARVWDTHGTAAILMYICMYLCMYSTVHVQSTYTFSNRPLMGTLKGRNMPLIRISGKLRSQAKEAAEQAVTILHSARQGSTGVRKEAGDMI